jgi:hypothetical protein
MGDPDALADMFDPAKVKQAGEAVLTHGLPELPGHLSTDMSIPVSSWQASQCAVVLFLCYLPDPMGGPPDPSALIATYSRQGGGWAAHTYAHAHGWSHDPVADPTSLYDLDGRMIAGGGSGTFNDKPAPGYPAAVVTGRVAPGVTALALIQDGHEDRRELRSHFGAWVVCTERWAPYQIHALDATGAVVGTITGPPRLPRSWPGQHGSR